MGGKRCAGLGLLLVPVALFGGGVAAQDQPPPPAETRLSPAIIVLDGSKSMWAKVDGQSKVAHARTSLAGAINDYTDKIAFGFVAFGHRQAAACADAELRAKAGDLTSKNQSKLLSGFKPRASKPIAAALSEAVKGAPADGGSLDVVLITDGVDSCKADVCATAQSLKQATPGLRVHVIGFDPKAKVTVKPLGCLPENTGGMFLSAANAAELKRDLAAILDEAAKPAPAAQSAEMAGAVPQAAAQAAPSTAQPAPTAAAPQPEASPPAAESNEVPLPAREPQSPTEQQQTAASETNGTTASAPAAGNPPPASPQAPPAPPQVEVMGPPRPGQTDMPKLAGTPRNESAAPPRSAPKITAPSLPVPVTFKALLTEAGPRIQNGVTWRVYAPEAGLNGGRKLLSTHREAVATAALVPGEYLVNAAYGLSNLTKKIKVEGGRSLEETFVLNCGGLKLAAVLATGEPLSPSKVHFDILSDEEDQFGNRRKILGNAKPGVVIRLNAGAYHLVSLYGDANATVRADVTVEPGKVTQATVKHAAATMTFRLVQRSGGEALADTRWQILTSAGDVVKENAGALPTHILAAGDYAVVATHNGASYTSKFNVAAGQGTQIEVVMEQGPTPPEVLKAIMEPPPPPEPPSGATAAPATPGSPDGGGMAFGGEPATPRAPGILPNPGALLRR